MNLFLSTIGKNPFGIYFNENLTYISEVYFQNKDFFLDRLKKNNEHTLKKVKKIFYISGPASFTALRNMSVFLNIFSRFSSHNIELFPLSSGEFFNIIFPHSTVHMMSVGRREVFILKNKKYKKYKNKEAIEFFKKNPTECIAGEFSDCLLEEIHKQIPQISFEFPLPPKDFLKKIMLKSYSPSKKAIIDYGALPHIG